jgi:hypothetical protein
VRAGPPLGTLRARGRESPALRSASRLAADGTRDWFLAGLALSLSFVELARSLASRGDAGASHVSQPRER